MTEETSTLQDFPLQASIQAVKASADFESYDDFYRYHLDTFRRTRRRRGQRYASLIGKRYFPGLSLDNLLPRGVEMLPRRTDPGRSDAGVCSGS